jgi:hypothetical protein
LQNCCKTSALRRRAERDGAAVPIAERVKYLAIGMPEVPTVLGQIAGTLALERALHRWFWEYRLRGEWFRNEGRLADWIDGGFDVSAPFLSAATAPTVRVMMDNALKHNSLLAGGRCGTRTHGPLGVSVASSA